MKKNILLVVIFLVLSLDTYAAFKTRKKPVHHKVSLSWSQSTDCCPVYRIYRSKDNKFWTVIGETVFSHYVDEDVLSGEVFYYKVTSITDHSESRPAILPNKVVIP